MPFGVTKNINIGIPQKAATASGSVLVVVLLVVICGLFTFFIILPKHSLVAAKSSQLQQLTDQESKISTQVADLNSLVGKLQNNPQDVQQLDEALPLNGKTFDLQFLIENLANSAGVTVGSINLSGDPGAVVAGNTALLADPFSVTRTMQTINGEVYVIGAFPQLLAFLQKIQDSDRIMQVSDLEITGDKNAALALKLTFTAYYFAP